MSIEHAPARKGVKRHRRKDASRYLMETWGISRTPKTLAKLAVTGGGPEIEYDGRIPTYTEPALDAFGEAVLSPPVQSTTELAALKREVAAHPLGGTREPGTAWSERCRARDGKNPSLSLADGGDGKGGRS